LEKRTGKKWDVVGDSGREKEGLEKRGGLVGEWLV